MSLRPTLTLTGDRCFCTTCGEHFNRSSTFTAHRVGAYQPDTRRCLTVAEMAAKGWLRNSAGFWITERLPARAVMARVKAANAGAPVGGDGSEPISANLPIRQPLNALSDRTQDGDIARG